jgi:putative two-component system response regulator
MNILIVDDDEVALIVLEQTLSKAGHQVVAARNGREALQRMNEEEYRLIVSDWQMPEMLGTDLCRAIRADHLSAYVYFILLTSRDTPHERVQGLQAGADDFIVKPFDPAELLARVGTAERVLSMETRDVAIFAMAKLAESRDPETGAHLERVRSYSRVLAQYLAGLEKFHGEITPEYARLIYLTSPLHDIGKVGIPDCVLLKPGRLSDSEFEIMKTHTLIGAKTLDAALHEFPGAKFLEMGRDIALTHHERCDGQGYPNHLTGSAIPLCGRIVAVADVYDALTSKRVYKAAFAPEVARSIIVAESGSHFDPDVVDAFLANQTQFNDIRNHFADAQADLAQIK